MNGPRTNPWRLRRGSTIPVGTVGDPKGRAQSPLNSGCGAARAPPAAGPYLKPWRGLLATMPFTGIQARTISTPRAGRTTMGEILLVGTTHYPLLLYTDDAMTSQMERHWKSERVPPLFENTSKS